MPASTPTECAPEVPDGGAGPRSRLLALVNAAWTTQALAAAVQLRLPELLAEAPATVETLAARTGCDAAALARLLRALTTLEVVEEQEEDGVYRLGALGVALRSDTPDGLGAWAAFSGGGAGWSAWHRLADCVRAGRTARELAGGAAGLQHLDADPQAAALFHRAMAALTHPVAQALAQRLPWPARGCVVDVGGGSGELLAVLLAAHAGLQGVLFDRPHAAAAARQRLQTGGLGARCRVLAGDFFDAVPAGGDVYLLKSIVHDWRDEPAGRLLQRCRAALRDDAQVVLVERLLPERLQPTEAHRAFARADLHMLVGPGGGERTLPAYTALLARAGLQVQRVTPLTDGYSAVVAEPSR